MDTALRVPAEALEDVQQTFAIDFGGSVIKLVYIKKDDVHPEGFKLIHRRIFAREQFQEALDFIKKECELPTCEGDDLPEFGLTGFGVHQYSKILKEQLKIKVKTLWEMDCFTEASMLLRNNLPDEELYHPWQFKGEAMSEEMTAKVDKMFSEFNMETKEIKDEDRPDPDSKWPCLFGMMGSAFAFMKVDKEGKTTQAGGSTSGGRLFLGLGSLLTGAKTYEELMELAEKGDDKNIHSYTSQLMKSDDAEAAENLYGAFGDFDFLAFPFGWCVGKPLSDFRREDLARALLVNVCRDIVQHAFTAAEKSTAFKIVLVGGFAQSALARRLLEEEFAQMAEIAATMMNVPKPTLHVMKAGSHLGALGALLKSKPKPESQPEKTTDSAATETEVKEKAVK